ncbi:hypothetical protein BDM02DRAFT_2062210 [Thelephora ganbajun]|uniref:Uncharacterized protein n=1 Tax=Thelephora ganbajun TaxID=370292 RepID=A0ACB6ZHC6_THEGA|nr:hypothetical protein BDM02DRAFT_2062210 [Thelephora ganbajun]
MNPRRTEEATPRPPRQDGDSTTPADRRPGVSFATKRGFLVQGRALSSDVRRRASRKNSPAESSSTNTGSAYIPGTKSAIKRLAPMTPPRELGPTPISSPPTSPRSPTYKPNLQELGLKDPGPNARLFERIPIQEQAYNRKSFTSKAETTAIWQRIPRPARDGELEIQPESLQTKLSDNFIPPMAGRKLATKTARKTQNSARPQRAAKNPAHRNRRGRGIAVKQPSRILIEVTDSSDPDSHNDLYASDLGHTPQPRPQAARAEGPSDEIMLTLQNLSDLTIQPPKAGAPGNLRRPPFLRSHLRKSFLKRCEAEGIPIKGGKMREPEITYIYRTLGSENTFKATVRHWGCPLCDTYSKLETQQVLERHLGDKAGGHPEVKIEMRRENVNLPRSSVD